MEGWFIAHLTPAADLKGIVRQLYVKLNGAVQLGLSSLSPASI